MMTSSEALIWAVKGFEGLRLEAYKCSGGEWTIGYGHTAGVREGDTCSKEEAEEMLRVDLSFTEGYINRLDVCRSQGQFDALVDFAFNCGCRALDGSTLLKKIKAGARDEEICREFAKWIYAGNTILPGLIRRRAWEAERWTAND